MLLIQELLTHVLRGLQAVLLFKTNRLLDNFHFFTGGLTPSTDTCVECQFDWWGAVDSKRYPGVTCAARHGPGHDASARVQKVIAIFFIAAYARNTGAIGLFDTWNLNAPSSKPRRPGWPKESTDSA